MTITPQELIRDRERPPKVVWVHGLKLLAHVLQGDTNQTLYRDNHPARSCYDRLVRNLKAPAVPEGLQAIFERTIRMKPRTVEVRDYMGCELDIDAYLGRAEKCYVDYRKENKPRTSLTVFIDMNVPHRGRGANYMANRHRLVYQLCASARNENQAIRIIAGFGVRYDEGAMMIMAIVKDYADPIYENIWGALRTNATTNDLLNGIMDYLIGTHHDGNGTLTGYDISKILPEAFVMVDPIMHTASNPKVKIIRTR
jgi:hypothetical protein